VREVRGRERLEWCQRSPSSCRQPSRGGATPRRGDPQAVAIYCGAPGEATEAVVLSGAPVAVAGGQGCRASHPGLGGLVQRGGSGKALDICHRQSTKRATMSRPGWPDSRNLLSDEAGTVQIQAVGRCQLLARDGETAQVQPDPDDRCEIRGPPSTFRPAEPRDCARGARTNLTRPARARVYSR